MAWRTPPAELVARFDAALPDDPSCERRQMFGCPAAFACGNMFAGVHQEDVFLRLDGDDRGALLDAGGRPFEPTPGRVMREYVLAPAALPADADALRRWLARAFAYAAALPPKRRRR